MSASSSSLMTFLRFLGVEEEGLEMRLFLTAGDEETVDALVPADLLLDVFLGGAVKHRKEKRRGKREKSGLTRQSIFLRRTLRSSSSTVAAAVVVVVAPLLLLLRCTTLIQALTSLDLFFEHYGFFFDYSEAVLDGVVGCAEVDGDLLLRV